MIRDHFDLWGGAILALCGAAVAAYSMTHYEFGELRRIGPGFFPSVLGVLLAGLGLFIYEIACVTAPQHIPNS